MSTARAELRTRPNPSGVPTATSESVPDTAPTHAVPIAGLFHVRDDSRPTGAMPSGGVPRSTDHIHRVIDEGRLARLRPAHTVGASGQGPGVVRRLPVPKATAGKTKLDTDKPTEFIAEIMAMKRAKNDDKIKKIIDWLKTNAPESGLVAQCEDIWINSLDDLSPSARPAGKKQAKKSAAQKKHEKKEKELQKKKKQEELAQIAAEQARAAKEAQDALALKAQNDFYAPIYWAKIQSEPGNSGHGGSLKFLIENKYVKVETPHRCFLSRFEKDSHGNRENNKFGLSVQLTPVPLVVGVGDQRLVIHLHCGGNGKVFGAGIKFLASERLPGGNILVESGSEWLNYLQVSGITGDNVETKVGAFN
jgi:hypothetical protein